MRARANHNPERLSFGHVVGEFPALSETFVTGEIRALRALGHRVAPLALGPSARSFQPGDADLSGEAVRTAGLPAARALALAASSPRGFAGALAFVRAQTGIRPRSLLLSGARVALAARRAGCDHLHAHFALAPAAAAIVASRLLGIGCSFSCHGYDVYGGPSDLAAKLRAADFAVAVCDDMAADLAAAAPEARIETIPCGVDPGRFRPLAEGGARNGALLAVGRFVPKKGYRTLLDALAAVPEERRPRLDMVGDGPQRAALEEEAAARGLSPWTRFLGPRPSDWLAAEAPAYLGFVAPYVIDAEGGRDTGPLTVKEAMAMGLPVAASALMGLKETVSPDVGRLVPPGDAAALAEALEWLAGMGEEERRRRGAAGRARIEARFDLNQQAAGIARAAARSMAARGTAS